MMAPNVAVPIPPIVKAPNLSVRSPAPAVSAVATVIRIRGLEKSTLFSTQIRPAMAAIKPNSTIDKPPMTGPGIERNQSTKFWREPQQDRDDGGNDKQKSRIDLCGRHHTDVLGVSRHPGAAAEAGNNRGQTVSQKRAAQEAIEASACHRADGFDVAKVLGDENDGYGCDQEHSVSVEARTGECRQTYPRRGRQCRKIDGLSQPEIVCEQ